MATHLNYFKFKLKFLLGALFVSILLSSLSHCAGVFLSIDCGSSESYKDENLIEWSGDDDFIQNGESKTVEFTSLVAYPLSTLRVFSTRKKNCYSVKVEQGERLLVRASFYYGNYDGNSSPPVFDLQFDGNYWTTVNTSRFDVVSHEMIYVAKGNSSSICLAQTLPDQLPFISALELRSLGSSMYRHVDPNFAMLLVERAAFGANTTMRYPVDAYDRIWLPATGFSLTTLSNDAASIKVTADDNPPPAVLRNAVTVPTTSNYIILLTGLPDKPVPIYIATYFSEVTRLSSTSLRSFRVHVDSKPYSDPIIPPFGGVSEVYITDRIASSRTSITVEATSDSTLPPLINAMEIYSLSEPLTNGTSWKDVEGLSALQREFEILQGWRGDPCLPSPYSWDWIECTSDATPRVTALYLSSFDLYGSLPDFSYMDALQTIDLHNNSLDGSIPKFLGDLPNLTLLNLSDNRFNGSIPTSITRNKKLKFVVKGNCFPGDNCKKITKTKTKTDTDTNSPTSSTKPTTDTPTSSTNPTTVTDANTFSRDPSAGDAPVNQNEFGISAAECRRGTNAVPFNNKQLLQFLMVASLFLNFAW